jgi:hypothetical protein
MTPPVPRNGEGGSGGAGGTRGLAGRLPRSMRGYDCAATDELLAQLGSRHAELERECVTLRERTAALDADLARRRRQEQVLSKSLLAASSQAMAIREEARREAALILRKARAELAKRAERAERVERERADAELQLLRLRALTEEIQQGLASLLTGTLELLRTGIEKTAEGPAGVEDQLALLRTLDAALKREGGQPSPSSADVASPLASPSLGAEL